MRILQIGLGQLRVLIGRTRNVRIMNGKLILIGKYMYKTVKYNIMGMRNENRGMDNKAVMTFRELENGESVDSGK